MLCTFCDSMYAVNGKKYKRMGLDSIMSIVREMGNRHICVTGGEPLMQEEVYPLIYELLEKQYTVTVETNGGVEIPNQVRSFMYIMDVKCPSSGMTEKNILENLRYLQSKDEVKFVIADREDYEYALNVLKRYPGLVTPVIFSPCFTPENESTIMKDLATWLINDKPNRVRLGIQIHKIVGVE